MNIQEGIGQLIEGNDLNQDEAYQIATEIMNGQTTDAQIGAFLISLRLKGETIDEITGFVKAMREKATTVSCPQEFLVDTCGTGGDQSGTFNISTLSGFVAAGAGCNIAKHGNRSVSSNCGSADLFVELGIRIDITPETMAHCITENGIGFLFAPLLHKAMKYAIGPRREIGARTIFNILGPLTNPAGAKRQLLGVFSPSLTTPLANTLKRLGSEHVMVVHGEDGLDEMTITGETQVSELINGDIDNYTVKPEDFGIKRSTIQDIQGGDPAKNAKIALEVLEGKSGPHRDMVLMNAGATIYVSDKVKSIHEGIHMAAESIDSGKAMAKLEKLIEITNKKK